MGDDRAFCEEMLPKVSRTFALCIRLLPPKVEYPVLVSYLLCRIADTIEDTVDLSGTEKGALLAHFGSCVEESGPDAGPIGVRFERALTDEERLAHQTDAVLREFRQLPSAQRASIRPWVQEMCSGMADFAMKQGDRSVPSPSEASESRGGSTLHALATVDDLERYCYYVAGTVGHLLTGLFHTIQPGVSDRRFEQLDKLATSFGLGLQLTNIIKDVADDRRRGWSYVPRELCEDEGIGPDELHDPSFEHKGRRVMAFLIAKAQAHLDDALAYCTTLPRSLYRVRLFCLTSMYFAVRTLRVAQRDPDLLTPDHKVKISRRDVYRTVVTTAVVAPSNALVRGYYRALSGSPGR